MNDSGSSEFGSMPEIHGSRHVIGYRVTHLSKSGSGSLLIFKTLLLLLLLIEITVGPTATRALIIATKAVSPSFLKVMVLLF